jgi:hypothetical protein
MSAARPNVVEISPAAPSATSSTLASADSFRVNS